MSSRPLSRPPLSRPVVGITLDSEPPGGYSKYPWYALRENYCSAVAQAGGLPLPLPHEPELAAAYLDRIDALVITGGHFDVDPALFNAPSRHATVKTKDRRTAFEFAIARGALDRDLPVLGICGGEQLLAVVLGGSLIQHIPDEIANALAHEQPNPRHEAGHPIAITAGTRLHRIAGATEMAVNSAHHQAVKAVPDGVIVNAVAPDGVIEGIESVRHRYCIGVQWHPEFHINPADARLFATLIESASTAAAGCGKQR